MVGVHQIQQKKDIVLLNKQSALQATSKSIQMTETSGYLDIHLVFFCKVVTSNLHPEGLEYQANTSLKQGFWRTVFLVLTNSSSLFFFAFFLFSLLSTLAAVMASIVPCPNSYLLTQRKQTPFWGFMSIIFMK